MLFGLLSGVRRKPKPVLRKPVRLRLEALETRDCPSPTITIFTAVPTNAPGIRQVELSGTVSDANPTSVVVQFYGVASGTTTVSANGAFDLITSASALGQEYAVATDSQGPSLMVSATVSSPPPVITWFDAVEGPAGGWTFAGHVCVPAPLGIVVVFSGPNGVTGLHATCDANGNFQATYILGTLRGGVSAQATDVWGQVSNIFYDPLT